MLDVVAILESPINYASDTRARISTHGGGAAANVATWLAHTGVPTFLIARVGDDAAGKTVQSELERYGVLHSNTVIPGRNTGVVIVLVDQSGERTMFPDWGANSGLGPEDLPDLSDITNIYLSGYPMINPASRPGVREIINIAREKNIKIVFDPASVGVLAEVGVDKVRSWLSDMHVLILNEEESHFLTGLPNPVHAVEDLLHFSEIVVIKRGAGGVLAQRRGESVIQLPALPTNVIDTTGAGDSFAAGFIRVWGQGGDLNSALSAGIELAAHCVSLIGARPLVAAL